MQFIFPFWERSGALARSPIAAARECPQRRYGASTNQGYRGIGYFPKADMVMKRMGWINVVSFLETREPMRRFFLLCPTRQRLVPDCTGQRIALVGYFGYRAITRAKRLQPIPRRL